jgi:hypothetical protein
VKLIARGSRGIVRRINVLADKALMAAFADDLPYVNSYHVRQAIEDSRYSCAAVPGNRSMIVFDKLLATCFRRRST